MEPSERDQAALQFIAEGVTEIGGFDVAAISVVRDGVLHTVAVAGDEKARRELAGLRTPVGAVLAELELAEAWGPLRFVPHEREGPHLAQYQWIPDLEVQDDPDAWHPHDLLVGLLSDADGVLRGVLSIDVPRDGMRPGPERRRILELYARQAERAVITALERGDIARDLAKEHAVAEYRAQLMDELSHELQNPLTAILQNAELLRMSEALSSDAAHGVEAIERGASRIQAMVEDLLVLARVGDPDRPVDALLDLVSIARGVRELLGADAEQRGVTVELAPEADEVLVLGDPLDLDALVANLVSNAVKYSDAGGRVTVRLRRTTAVEGGLAEVVVEDDGVGIAEHELGRVFEEFFRSGDPEVRRRPGTGLGLAIAERAAARHGGRIQVASHPGQGSTFTVLLPLYPG